MGYFDKLSLDPTLFRPLEPEPVESRGLLRGAADTALSFGQGAVQGVRMFTDLAGADNAASAGLRSVEDAIDQLKSAQAKQDQQEVARILSEAEGAGILDQVVAGAKAFAVAPGQMLAQAAGTTIPTLAAALVPGAGPAALAGRLALPAAVGAAQGVGTVKGSIYDAVLRGYKEDGATDEEAKAAAVRAQEYSGENAGQLALGGAFGALAGSSGLESAAQGLKFGARSGSGMLSRVAKGAAFEAIPEGLQGGQEKYAANTALINEGADIDPMSGVFAAGTMEAAAGAPLGGAFGIPKPKAQPIADIAPILGAESIDEAINAASDAVSQPTSKRTPEAALDLLDSQRMTDEALTRKFGPEDTPLVDVAPATIRTAQDFALPAATAEAEPAVVEPTDLTTQDGVPYGSKTAANVRAVKEGLTPANVVEIPGAGWVIRPQLDAQPTTLGTTIEGRPNNTRGTTAADVLRTPDVAVTDLAGTAPLVAGAGDVVGTDAGRGGRDIRPDADANGGIPVAATAPVPSSGTAVAVGNGSAGSPNTLTPGATVTLDGKPWTVTESTPAAVKLADGEGSSKFISVGSRTWAKIAPATPSGPAATPSGLIGEPRPVATATPVGPPVAPPVRGAPTPTAEPAPVATTRAGSEPQTAAPDERQALEEKRQMVADMIATKKANREAVPDAWVKRMADISAQIRGETVESGAVYSMEVPGHPLFDGPPVLRNLIPIKVKTADDAQRALDRALGLEREVATEFYGARQALKSAKTAGEKKAAQARVTKLNNQGWDEDALKMLRDETIGELSRLVDAAPKSAATPQPPVDTKAAPAEPWQMTREEAAKDFPGDEYDKMLNRASDLGDISYDDASKRSRIKSTGGRQFWAQTRKQVEQGIKDAVRAARGERADANKMKASEGYAAWRIRATNLKNKAAVTAAIEYGDGLLAVHKERVQEALAEGKDVPAEVLADYPDLKPKALTETATRVRDTLKGAEPKVKIVPKFFVINRGLRKGSESVVGVFDTKAEAVEAAKDNLGALIFDGTTGTALDGNGRKRTSRDDIGSSMAYAFKTGEYTESARLIGMDDPDVAVPEWKKTVADKKADFARSDDTFTEFDNDQHRAAVEMAVKLGKPVPAEVLADYPDLSPQREPGSATLTRPDTDPAVRKRQQEVIDRLNTYERDLWDRVSNSGQSEDSAHNSALGMAGLTEDGLLQARGWAGLYPTMKPGIVVKYDGPLTDISGKSLATETPAPETSTSEPTTAASESAAPETARPARDETTTQTIALRKRMSVLRSLLDCMG